MRPLFKFFGGIALLVVDGIIQGLSHAQALEFIKHGSPALYAVIVGTPFSLVLILIAIGFIAAGSIGIRKDRKPLSQAALLHNEAYAQSSGVAVAGGISAGPGSIVAVGASAPTALLRSHAKITGNVIQAYLKLLVTSDAIDPNSMTVTDSFLLAQLYLVNEGHSEPAIRALECHVSSGFHATANDRVEYLDPFVLIETQGVLKTGSFQAEYRDIRHMLRNLCRHHSEPLRYGVPRQGWVRFEFRQKSEEDFRGASFTVTVIDGLGAKHNLIPCNWPWPQPHRIVNG